MSTNVASEAARLLGGLVSRSEEEQSDVEQLKFNVMRC